MNKKLLYRSIRSLAFATSLALMANGFVSCHSAKAVISPTADNVKIQSQVRMDGELDATVDSIISIRRVEIAKLMRRPIGKCDTTMESRRPESSLMRFIADATLVEAQKVCKELNLPIPTICLQNTGGIRATMPGGEVTVQTIYEISPFENSVVVVGATGEQLTRIFKHIARRGGEPLSGAKLVINDTELESATVNGLPVDPEKTYWIVTNSYVAQGGDGFSTMTECQSHDTGFFIRDLLIRHIESLTAQGKSATDPGNNRIIKK